MEKRLVDVNDLWRYSVVKEDGHRYVPWVAIPEVPTAEVRCPQCGTKMDGGNPHAEK